MGVLSTVIHQPEELPPLVQMAWAAHKAARLPKERNLAFCYDMLNKVGRRCTRFLMCLHQATCLAGSAEPYYHLP